MYGLRHGVEGVLEVELCKVCGQLSRPTETNKGACPHCFFYKLMMRKLDAILTDLNDVNHIMGVHASRIRTIEDGLRADDAERVFE